MKHAEFTRRMNELVEHARELFKDMEEHYEATGEKFTLLIQAISDDSETGGASDRFAAIGNVMGLESTLCGVLAHNLLEMHHERCETCSKHDFSEDEFHRAMGEMLINAVREIPGFDVEEKEEVRHVH